MTLRTHHFLFIPTFLFLFFFSCFSFSFAFTKERVETSSQNDFVLSPAKVEAELLGGESGARSLTVTNRTERRMNFAVSVEDFSGTNDPGTPVELLGKKQGAYSLKDFLTPEISAFSLESGEKITFSVGVSLPQNVAPGGLYGSVLISEVGEGEAVGAAAFPRLSALFFVRVKGDAEEVGVLESFKIKGEEKLFYTKGPLTFEFLYKNTGNVHLVPYGYLEIKNGYGKIVETIEVDPYFALPDSVRFRDIVWEKKFLFGLYEAELVLNRGYDDEVDRRKISFWVMPWWGIPLLVFLVLGVCFASWRITKVKSGLRMKN